ncbi:unnamed protein product [Protopolystoma xenopodis]|uniref:Uncharacterized protein n=1 Tax=Protopolystoma xenopodis TaxID=117903 RepID=A0A448XMD1_9PLAT|nr:unnamed protein product [Protopolystoma xenopodis]
MSIVGGCGDIFKFSSDQHVYLKVLLKLKTIPLKPETTVLLEKGLNFSIQHNRSLLGDILVEIINITGKFPEEKNLQMELEVIPKILTLQEHTHRNRFTVIRKSLETNEQLVLNVD